MSFLGTVTIYPSMTDEEFFSALEIEGLPKEDCEILKGNEAGVDTRIQERGLRQACMQPHYKIA